MALRYKYPSASIDAEEQGDKPDIPWDDHDKSRASNYKGMIKETANRKQNKTPQTLIIMMFIILLIMLTRMKVANFGTKTHLNQRRLSLRLCKFNPYEHRPRFLPL
jgi:hypothetical protein